MKKNTMLGHLTLPSYSQCGRFEFRTGTGREKIGKTYSFFQSKIFLIKPLSIFFFRLRFQFQNSWFVLTRHSLLQGSFYIFGWRPSKSRLKFCWAFSFGTNCAVLWHSCGLYYKHVTIVNDNSSVDSKWSLKLIDDPRVVIYDCHRFIVQASEKLDVVESSVKNMTQWRGENVCPTIGSPVLNASWVKGIDIKSIA